jgi:hypothetical protein
VIEETIAQDNPDAILTLGLRQRVFAPRGGDADAADVLPSGGRRDRADQSGRGKEMPLFTVHGEDGHNAAQVQTFALRATCQKAATAHFGMTLLRADKFAKLPKPWFADVPDGNGGWGEGRTDADVAFWRKWEAAGNTLHIANRVTIGHMELMVRWPGHDLRAVHQSVADWRERGKPQDIWQ